MLGATFNMDVSIINLLVVCIVVCVIDGMSMKPRTGNLFLFNNYLHLFRLQIASVIQILTLLLIKVVADVTSE